MPASFQNGLFWMQPLVAANLNKQPFTDRPFSATWSLQSAIFYPIIFEYFFCFLMNLIIFSDVLYNDLVAFHNGNGKARNFKNYSQFIARLTLDYIQSCRNSQNWYGRVEGLTRKWDKQMSLARAQL